VRVEVDVTAATFYMLHETERMFFINTVKTEEVQFENAGAGERKPLQHWLRKP
jgi:hypothetical protein